MFAKTGGEKLAAEALRTGKTTEQFRARMLEHAAKAPRAHGGHRHERARDQKLHLAVDTQGLPLRGIVTAGSVADCIQVGEFVREMNARGLIADKGYDNDEVVNLAQNMGMQVVISPWKNRRQPHEYNKYIYRLEHRVENAFLDLKQ